MPEKITLPAKSDLGKVKDVANYFLDEHILKRAEGLYCKDIVNDAQTPADVFEAFDPQAQLGLLNTTYFLLSEEDLSVVLSHIWSVCESPNMDPNMTKAMLVRLFSKCDRQLVMDENDYKLYSELPDEVTIYRGVGKYNGKNVKALSWTLGLEKARWFMNRFQMLNVGGGVYKAQIKKKYIFAYLNKRKEKEVVVDYHKLQNIELIEEPKPAKK